jgi:hypothetical protein
MLPGSRNIWCTLRFVLRAAIHEHINVINYN